MNDNVKIAIYTGTVPSTTFIERLVQGLTEKGLQIYLFGLQKKKSPKRDNTYYITYSNKLSKLLFLIKYSLLLTIFNAKDKKRLNKIILNSNKNTRQLKIKYYPVLYHRPDIFHLQWAKSIEDWIWVQEFGIKLVLSLRGTHITISPISDTHWKNIYFKIFPRVDGFHAVSKSMIPLAQRFGAISEKIKVVRSGLDIEKLPFTLKSEITRPLTIVSIGRSHWTKGYDYALDAMNLLAKENIDFSYTIVGVENDEELLFKREQFKLSNKILLTGKLPYTEVLKLIKNADVLLLPSVEEGIANVVLEAMALGTLVISTECGGMSEAITNNKNGFLIPIRNSAAIASAIKIVSEISIDSYEEFTKAARKTIEKNFNYNDMILEMKELYHTVLKE